MEQTPPREHQYHSHTEPNTVHGPHIPLAAETAVHHQHHKRETQRVSLPRGLMIIAGLVLVAAIWNFAQNHSLNGGIKVAAGLDILLAIILLLPYELARRTAIYCAAAVLVIELLIGGILLKDRQSALNANNKSVGITQTNIQKSTSPAERQYYTKVNSELTAINKKLDSSYGRAVSLIAGAIGFKLVAIFYLARLRTRTEG